MAQSVKRQRAGRVVRSNKPGASLRSNLLPHQKRVVERIRKQPGLVVAHGTGSGKTLSSIGAAVDLSPQRARVLVPAALKENYRKEVEKHVKGGLPIEIDSLQQAIREGKPPRGDLLIVDEAHRLRSSASKGQELIRRSPAKKRMLLTASPVYNKPEDVAPLVNLAAGSERLPQGSAFHNRYVEQPSKGFFDVLNPFARKDPKIIHRKELKKVLNKWVDYQGSSDAGFPSLEEERVNVPMSKRQSDLHAAAWGKLPHLSRMRMRRGLPPSKKDLASINQFQSQTRQISSSEKKYSLDGAGISPKLQVAAKRLRDATKKNPRHKAVVYANYLATLDDYAAELNKKNVPYASFRGDMKKNERDRNVRDFNEGKIKALLVSGAGGEGLDLKGTRQVQVLEPHWNEEKIRQIIGRARRYKSHDHLPPRERNVKVERYAARPKGMFGQKKGIEDVLYDTSARKQKLNDQVLDLMTKTGAERREFAPGIPRGRVIRPLPRVSSGAANEEWDVSLSLHPAAVRGDHYDLRLVDPKGRAHSWAALRMPEPGKSTYAAQTATHSKKYALRDKPWSIPPGYGATRPGKKVEPVYVQKAEVVESGKDKVRFLRHHGQETDEIVLRKVRDDFGKPVWAINNATKNRNTREGQRLPSSKPKYRETTPGRVSLASAGEVMTPKFDGAHVLVDLKGPKAPMRVYSYRPTARKTGVIEHTFKFPDFQNRRSSPSTKNTMLRAELWGSRDGKAVPAEELGGILNAGVPKSRDKQREKNVKLRLTGIDVVRHKGRNYENKTFEQKLNALRQVTRGTRGVVETPPVARTEDEKRNMLDDVKSGRLPETKEGVVLHRIDSAAPPVKVKFKPQHDVYVRDVFDKPRGRERGHAGGFSYSTTADGPVVGKVGTGFDHSTRKSMLDNPQKYIGRVAKVKSQGPYRSGALRSPSFDEWHIDKSPPELMKEGGGSILDSIKDYKSKVIGEVPPERLVEISNLAWVGTKQMDIACRASD